MSKAFSGLDLDFADPRDLQGQNGIAEAGARAFWERERAHTSELEEMIRMGWGDVDQPRVPKDWRTRRGPDNGESRRRAVETRRRLRSVVAPPVTAPIYEKFLRHGGVRRYHAWTKRKQESTGTFCAR